LGTKTIGARCPIPISSRPASNHPAQGFQGDAARLLAIAGERNAVGFVLGLPSTGRQRAARAIHRAFARNSPTHQFRHRLWTSALHRRRGARFDRTT